MQPVNNELNSTRTRKWDQFSLKRRKSTNTYRRDLSWLHFEDVPRVQEKQQVKEQNSYIPVFVDYLTYPIQVAAGRNSPDMKMVFNARSYVIRKDKEQHQVKETS